MKNIILVCLSIFPFLLNAQSENQFILRSNFGYSYSHMVGIDNENFSEYGYYRGGYGEIDNKLNFSLNAGRKLKSNFYYGLGIDYRHLKHEVNPEKDVPNLKPNPSSGYNVYYGFNNTNTIGNTWSPYLYFQYFSSLTDRLTISFQSYSKYDFYNEEIRIISYYPNTVDYVYEKYPQEIKGYKKQFLNFGLQPSLRFRVYKKMGIELSFGAIRYQLKTKDSRVQKLVKMSSEFDLRLKPENWQLGLYITL